MRIRLKVAEYAPDLPPDSGGDNDALGVYAVKGGYVPMKSFTNLDPGFGSSALAARCQGFLSIKNDPTTNLSSAKIFAGDVAALYRGSFSAAVQGAFTDISNGTYATGTYDFWEFAQWGNNVIATNYANNIQVAAIASGSFADLGGSPPKARHIAVVRDFVVLGFTNESSTAYPRRVRWSGINNSTAWGESASTQADYQDIAGSYGVIRKIVGGQFGTVFMETGILRMTYVGSPVIFQFDVVSENLGTPAPQSVVSYGGVIYFLGNDGFYAMPIGGLPVRIGKDKVDRTFLASLTTLNRSLVQCAVDPFNNCIVWGHNDGTGTVGQYTDQLVYNIGTGRWTRSEVTGEKLGTVNDYEGLSTIGSFSTAHKILWPGTSNQATQVDTVEKDFGRQARITNIRPIVDGNAASAALRYRLRPADALTTSSAVSQNAFGFCPVRVSASRARVRITTSGAFNFIEGADVEFNEAGDR